MSQIKINSNSLKEDAEREWRELAAKRVSQHFGRIVPAEHLKAWQGKLKGYVQTRFYAVGYLRAHGLSFYRIRDIIGYTDHTSAIHARNMANAWWTAEHFEKLALADEQDVQGKKWRAA